MDTQKDSNSVSLRDPISFFSQNERFVFVYKKTEKLATALYMVTNLFSDNEPMKWALRKRVGDLLSFTVSYKDIKSFDHVDFAQNVKTRVLEITSLLEVASNSGLVSPMNFSIMKEEFSRLTLYLEEISISPVQHADTSSSLPKTFFDVPRPTINKDAHSTQGIVQVQRAADTKDSVSHSIASGHGNDSDASGSVLKRNSRQNIIIQLIKKKKEISIGDVSEVIKNCSEKTIQRELISLIQGGVLKKSGERRWSRYSLV